MRDGQAPTASDPAIAEGLLPLEAVVFTHELRQRPGRAPDYAAENRALILLTQALAGSPRSVLQTLADLALDVFKVDSAGISLLTQDETSFVWPAIAGEWKECIGSGVPRDFSPCGAVLDGGAPVLFKRFDLCYGQPDGMPLPEEALLLPFYIEGKPLGTLWLITHGQDRHFDREDLRQLESLGQFASAACKAVQMVDAAQAQSQLATGLLEESVQSSLAMARLHAEVKEGGAFIRSIIDSSPDCIKVLDLQGNLLSMQSGQALLGIEDIGPFLNTSWLDFWTGEDRLAAASAVASAVAGGKGNFVGFFRTLRGEAKWWDVALSPILDTDGKPQSLLAVSRDVTLRKHDADALAEQSQALVDLDRRKDEFLAMLSHELRNPLAAISNAAHLLRLQKNEDPVHKQVRGIIERQVGQLNHLVSDLLEISRITTGRVRLRLEQVAIQSIVERAVETTQALMAQRRHALTVTLPPEPIWLYADAARLEQVVVNLLTNAAKYTEEGGQIALGAARDGDSVVLRVHDNGIGIAPELLPHIFDLFTQAERSLDRSEGGLGIGLCLVQRLVDLHSGSVQAHSVVGQGSEFVVELPLMQARGTRTPLPARPTLEPDSAMLRALVVDDNVDAAISLADILRLTGHEVRVSHDGLDALQVAGDWCPDLVLLDIGLPGLTGLEVARRIRAQPRLRKMVLVALTGYGQETDRLEAMQAGFDHHMVKPAEFAAIECILDVVAAAAAQA